MWTKCFFIVSRVGQSNHITSISTTCLAGLNIYLSIPSILHLTSQPDRALKLKLLCDLEEKILWVIKYAYVIQDFLLLFVCQL